MGEAAGVVEVTGFGFPLLEAAVVVELQVLRQDEWNDAEAQAFLEVTPPMGRILPRRSEAFLGLEGTVSGESPVLSLLTRMPVHKFFSNKIAFSVAIF